MRIAQRFRGERRHHLAKMHVSVRERFRLALGAEEDRADDGTLPLNRHDDDRSHVARVQRRLDRAQHRVARRVRYEHRLLRVEGALELRIAIQIDDEIANRRIFVARDEPDFVLLAREKDRASVQAKGITKLACDTLQNIHEVQRRGYLLQDVDDGAEMIAFLLQLGHTAPQPRDLVVTAEARWFLRYRRGRGSADLPVD